MNTRNVAGTAFVLLAAMLGVAGWLRSLGTVVLQANSPDKRWVASCRDFPSLDGPNQRLIVIDVRTKREIMRHQLFEDTDWCDQIVWSQDARVVGFVVRGERLVLYTPQTRRTTHLQLIAPDGSYPGDFEAMNVRFQPNTVITFQTCRRGTASRRSCAERTITMRD